MTRWRRPALIAFFAASIAIGVWLLPAGREVSPVAFAEPRARAQWPIDRATADAMRSAALHRARVRVPVQDLHVDLGTNPQDPTGTLSEPIVRCRYLDSAAHGTTAKF